MAKEIGPGRAGTRMVPVLTPEQIAALPAWSELFPQGRHIFYEGDNPAEFVRQIQAEFGFNPADDPHWGEQLEDIEGPFPPSYGFHCPADHIDEIYGSGRFCIGS